MSAFEVGLVLWVGPAVAVAVILVAWWAWERLTVRFERWRDDRHSAPLVRRYRNVTRVSLDPQACEQRRAPRELKRLREFYEQKAREEATARRCGIAAKWAAFVASLPSAPVRRSNWS